jgi:hypothetical protein
MTAISVQNLPRDRMAIDLKANRSLLTTGERNVGTANLTIGKKQMRAHSMGIQSASGTAMASNEQHAGHVMVRPKVMEKSRKGSSVSGVSWRTSVTRPILY